MATTTLSPRRLVVMISILLAALSIISQCRIASASEAMSTVAGLNPRAGGRRFLANLYPQKGDRCNPGRNNICSGIQANNGTELLHCCKSTCSDVLAHRDNCGECNNRCGFGQLCCQGRCTTVAYDVNNCGTCGNVCQPGLRCEYGSCGYA